MKISGKNENNYVLENNKNFKILLLYVLRTLDNDTKQKIIKKLINTEILYNYIFLENIYY